MTREEKIAALRTDFLDRDQDRYVKIRRSGRLGWESMIPAGGNYSDILRGNEDTADLVKESYAMARDYIVAMDTPYHVTLRLSPQRNCTDSKVVYLATRVFDDKELTDGQKMDTFIGLAIHEGCHLKWTDFTQMAGSGNRIIRNLTNILEDERIERLCGEHLPGYANYLKSAKYYMFDLWSQRQAAEPAAPELEEGTRLLNAVLSLVRYPKTLRSEDLETFADELFEVRGILLDFPENTDEVSTAAKAIYEIIRKFFEKKEQQQTSAEGDTGTESEDSSSRSEETDTESVTGQKVQELLSALGQAMDDIASDPGIGSQPMDISDIADCVKKNSCQLASICENSVLLGHTPQSVLYRAQEKACVYMESLSRIRKYIPAIAKTLHGHCTEHMVTYHGMRSGLLDTGKLAEAHQGVQSVYIREGRVRSDRMAVCVLIDESGSMYGDKIRAARDLGVLLNEAVSTVPGIDLYIYGHTYGDRCRDSYKAGQQITEIQIYREKGFAPKRSLGSVEARSGNLDSFAIREAASRMRRLSAAEKNLMFVITDGAPNEKYEQLASTVKQLERQGIDIVAICIEPNYDPSRLYTNHVTMTDMNRLAPDLGKMIKKSILKSSCRHAE